MTERNEHQEQMWSRFCRLGEMIGDGLHNEPDGKWISREYKKLSKILLPDKGVVKRLRKNSAEIDLQMKELLSRKQCHCGGEIKQVRSGAKTAKCISCGQKYVAKPIKISK